MRELLETVLLVIWIALFFGAGSSIAKRAGLGRPAAALFGVVVVVAFLVGSAWHPSTRVTGTPVAEAPAAVAAAVAPAAAPAAAPATPVGAAPSVVCAAGAALRGKGIGHMDAVAVAGRGPVSAAGTISLMPRDVLEIVGWTASPERPARAVCVVVDGKVVATVAQYGGSRPDVATAYHNPRLEPTSFTLSVPAVSLGRGHHSVDIAALDASGTAGALLQPLNVVVQ